jgi:hypothetical protein
MNGRQQRTAERSDQRVRHRMCGNANADGATFDVAHPRCFARCGKNEGVRPGKNTLHRAKNLVLDDRVAARFGQRRANDRQRFFLIELTQRVKTIDGRPILDVRTEPVDRVGRIDDHFAFFELLFRLLNLARLGMFRVNLE